MNANVLMLVQSSLAMDSRVRREAEALVAAGYSVHIIGKRVPIGYVPPEGVTFSSVGGSSVLRPEDAPSLGSKKLSAPVRMARWMLLPTHRESAFQRWRDEAVVEARKHNFDVVHAHDYNTVAAGVHLASERGVPLVYDSHEFWTGMDREYRPTPLLDRRERRDEGELGAQATAVITVSDAIAARFRQIYGWGDITVVRNSFQAPAEQPPVPETPTAVVYAGRLCAHRDLEVVARASHQIALPVQLFGPQDPAWLAGFDPGRAEVSDPVSVDEAAHRIAQAGLSLVTLADGWVNHRLAMPNKVFQAVSLGVPVVASDLGELGSLVREYGVGTLYRPGDPASLADAVERAVERYPDLRSAVVRAQADLTWEVDAARLVEVYARLAPIEPPVSGMGQDKAEN